MDVGRPTVALRDGKIYYTTSVRTGECTRQLWFRVDVEHSSMITKLATPAILAMLIPAMKRGEDLHVDGEACPMLLWRLNNEYQDLLRIVMPHLKKILVRATPCEAGVRAAGVSTGFSGGIDAFTTLAQYLSPATPEGLRLTHLVFHDVGQNGVDPRIAEARFGRLLSVVASFGLPFVKVESNVCSFYEGLAWTRTHTIRNVAAAYLLQNEVGTYLYSSGREYSGLELKEDVDSALYDPIALPLLGSCNFQVASAGASLRRTRKTEIVAQIPESHKYLDVCKKPPTNGANCSKCEKCLRAMLTLEILGVLQKYQTQFDFEQYSKRRRRFISEVLVSDDFHQIDIRHFAADKNFRFPLSAYFLIPFTWSALKFIPPIKWLHNTTKILERRLKSDRK